MFATRRDLTTNNCALAPDSRMRSAEHSSTCFTRKRSERWRGSNTSEFGNSSAIRTNDQVIRINFRYKLMKQKIRERMFDLKVRF